MRLEIERREAGDVTILRCEGRIIAGEETGALQAAVDTLLATRADVVVDLEGVTHIDSSGLGALLRIAGMADTAGVRVVFCRPNQHLTRLFCNTRLDSVLPVFESAQDAMRAASAAIKRGPAGTTKSRVLCVERSVELLMLMTELLKLAGFEVLAACNFPDAVVLCKASSPTLVLIGPSMADSGAQGELRQAAARLPLVLLDRDFASAEAGEAGALLLEKVSRALG